MTAVFLSYASTDVALATELHERLREAGYASVFRDRDRGQGIPAGALWARELFSQLERAEVVVFLATATSLASSWCHTELAVAVARGRHVVQVAVEALPAHPVLSDRQCLPPAADLRELVGELVRDLERVGFPAADPFGWDPGVSPYPGLRRLDQQHAAVLFGRNDEIATLVGRVAPEGAPPVLVVGPSGSGKSSLVRAGLLPRLALQPGTVVLPAVEPGRAPLRRVAAAMDVALAAAHLDGVTSPSHEAGFEEAVDRLTARGGRVVLVLDQAEDVLADRVRDEAAELLARLGAVDRARLCLVVVLRSASLEAWLRDTALAGIAPGDPVWVRPLDRAGLREVVVGPARLAGIRFEPPELVEQVLDDTGDGYALPLLAALLQELTEGHSRLEPAVITAERYRTLGPVSRVVERRAAAALAQLQAEQGVDEATVVQAYLRLVDVSGERQVTRAEVVLAELPPDVVQVLTVLEQHRLVARDRRVVEGEQAEEVVTPVHEEVFRAWPALRAALDEQRADLELRSALRKEARSWQDSGGGRVVLAGGRLERAQDWARRRPHEVEAPVRAYVAAAARERRRRRALLVAAPLLVLAVVVVGGLAVSLAVQAGRAEQARELAEGLRLAGEARSAGASRPDLGLLLALEAAERGSDQQLQAAPLVALTRGPGAHGYQPLPGPLTDGALDAAGVHAVLLRPGETLLWDAAAARTEARLPAASAVALSGDGRVLVLAAPTILGATSPAAPGLAVHEWPSTTPVASCAATGGSVELLRLTGAGDRLVVVTADRDRSPPSSTVTVLGLPTCARLSATAVNGLVVDADVDGARDRLVLAVTRPGAAADAPARSGVQVWQLSSGLPFERLSPAAGVVRAVAQDDTHGRRSDRRRRAAAVAGARARLAAPAADRPPGGRRAAPGAARRRAVLAGALGRRRRGRRAPGRRAGRVGRRGRPVQPARARLGRRTRAVRTRGGRGRRGHAGPERAPGLLGPARRHGPRGRRAARPAGVRRRRGSGRRRRRRPRRPVARGCRRDGDVARRPGGDRPGGTGRHLGRRDAGRPRPRGGRRRTGGPGRRARRAGPRGGGAPGRPSGVGRRAGRPAGAGRRGDGDHRRTG